MYGLERCVYFCVVERCSCPIIILTTLTSIPDCTRLEQKVCLKSWKLKSIASDYMAFQPKKKTAGRPKKIDLDAE